MSTSTVNDWATKFAPGANPVKIHLIGVAGSGMSGLASLYLELGHSVSGSDKVTTAETNQLQSKGLKFSSPHTAEAVAGCDVVVYSSAVKTGNPAYDAAVAAGIPLLRRAEALAAIMLGNRGIVIAGTHGKTTTSALAAHLLRIGGKQPSHYVGAEIPILGSNAHWDSTGGWFVAEGDESDGTLVNFHPEHAVLLNVEAEHLDHYTGGIDEILSVFHKFCDQTKGSIIYCGDDKLASSVCSERKNAISYGLGESCDYRAIDLEPKGAGTEFTIVKKNNEVLGRLRLGIPGQHNVLNSLAAIALGDLLEVSFDRMDEALSGFRGAKRRFEIKHQCEQLTIIDDYGHHPTEIAATIETARSQHQGRLICLFQPHRFTRTQLLRDEFGKCFDGVDELWVTDIYPASEAPIEGISGQTIVDAVDELGTVAKSINHPDLNNLHLAVGRQIKPGDWIITLGAGNIHEVGTKIAKDFNTLKSLGQIVSEPNAVFKLYEPMRKHSTMKVGGPAQFWVEPTTIEGFARLIKHCCDSGTPLRVIGRGSNLLIRDGGIAGVVANPVKGDFSQLEVLDERTIIAGAGVKFKALATAAQRAGIGGFEWMEGVPGAVGGSLRMNAGAMGTETFDQVISVKMIDADGRVFEKTKQEIIHHYRNVPELVHNIAVSAVFVGEPAPAEEIAEKMEASKAKRKTSQPIAASAGCAFKNPMPTLGAGQLVDEMGLKNKSVGKARVSEVHGNFIVNEGGASAAEVLELIAQITAEAKAERNIDLETEVQIIGQDEPV